MTDEINERGGRCCGLRAAGRPSGAAGIIRQLEKRSVRPREIVGLAGIAGNGQTVSDELLRRYSGEWQGNIDHIFEEFAF